jgi:Leu/Phe-tRNA-protein transferase
MNNITDYQAVGLAEGWIEGNEKEIMEAWQHLHDTGLAYKLQGWFGRTAQDLLKSGYIV